MLQLGLSHAVRQETREQSLPPAAAATAWHDTRPTEVPTHAGRLQYLGCPTWDGCVRRTDLARIAPFRVCACAGRALLTLPASLQPFRV